MGGGVLGLGEWLGRRPVKQQLVSAWVRTPSPGPWLDLRNGGEKCWPILSIITATVFSYNNILEFLLSLPQNQRRPPPLPQPGYGPVLFIPTDKETTYSQTSLIGADCRHLKCVQIANHE